MLLINAVSSVLTLRHNAYLFSDMLYVFPGFPLQSWVFTKGQGKGALTPTPPSESPESTAIEVEDIPALLRDVARFAEAVEKLKDVVLAEGNMLSSDFHQSHRKRPKYFQICLTCQNEFSFCLSRKLLHFLPNYKSQKLVGGHVFWVDLTLK